MSQPSNPRRSKLSRRTLFAGAGSVGAAAAVASLVPGALQQVTQPDASALPAPEGTGYRLTDHVKRYYKSTLV